MRAWLFLLLACSGSRVAVPSEHRVERCSRARVIGVRILWETGCTHDAQCTAGANGRCGAGSYEAPVPNRCYYDACYAHADCPLGTACQCGPGASDEPHRCVPAECRADRDCPRGRCSPSREPCAGVAGWYCRDASRDACADDRDCRSPSRCAYDEQSAAWRCDRGAMCK
jgi:hypothetical protein